MCGIYFLCLTKETRWTFAFGESHGQCVDTEYAVGGAKDLLSALPHRLDRGGSFDLAGGRCVAPLAIRQSFESSSDADSQPMHERGKFWNRLVFTCISGGDHGIKNPFYKRDP